jgi:hypothetical protein
MNPKRAILGATLLAGALVLLTPGCRSRVQYHPSGGPALAGAQLQPPGETAPDGWAEVSPPGTGLACHMPGLARYDQRVGRESDGAFYRTVSARAEVPYGSFGVIVTEWEGGLVGDPLETARDVADNLFSQQQLDQRRSQRLDMAGFYAREDTGLAPNGVFVALRQFVGSHRIYVAMAIVANAPAPLRMAESFMSSVRLGLNDALLPVGQGEEAHALFLPETDFAVRMPPLTSRRTADLDLGERSAVAHTFVSQVPNARLRVRVIDLPRGEDLGDLEEIAAHLGLGDAGSPVSASGFPGASFSRTSGDTAVEGRIFQTASRVYVLEAASPTSGAPTQLIRTFFDSFRIL